MSREIEWINDYTALITTDEDFEKGDRLTIESRPVEIDSLWAKFKIKIEKFFTPDYRYYNIHLEKDELRAKVIDTSEDSETYVVETESPVKYYPSNRGSIGDRVRRK